MAESTGIFETELLPDDDREARLAAIGQGVPDQVRKRFLHGMFWTDGLVDTVVEDFADMDRGRGWRLLDEALNSVTPFVAGAPASLRELLGPLMEPPSWFDADKVRWGAAVWWRFEPAVVIGMTGALRLSYQWGDLNKPQAMNGRSVKMAARRYEETARWVLSATDPGTVVPGGSGFNDTVKIRLVHAMVRRRLRRAPAWNTGAWGEPIHGTGMALTNNAFLLLPMSMFQLLGAEFTDDELEAVRALWQWIGYLMGVPDELLPVEIEEARQLAAAAPKIFAPPDQDSADLDRALAVAGVRAERIFPNRLRPVLAPIARPLASRIVWGTSNTILNRLVEHQDDPTRVRHPLMTTLRPIVARYERLRRSGRLGTDFDIASRQRGYLERSLALIDAAPHALHPRQAAHSVA
ncbi:hypothetical protein DMB37_39760 [Nocardia sp. CS682]|nr:hypothetical protein DMB37_39760 [Nocardia sp. CS682]